MSEGETALEPNIAVSTFDTRRILTSHLKFWEDIAKILPYKNLQGNLNQEKAPMRHAKNAYAVVTHYRALLALAFLEN